MNGQIDRLDRHAVKMIKYVDMSMNLFYQGYIIKDLAEVISIMNIHL